MGAEMSGRGVICDVNVGPYHRPGPRRQIIKWIGSYGKRSAEYNPSAHPMQFGLIRNESNMHLATQRQAGFSLATVFAALVCFFLPWFQLSCGAEKVASVSGWQLAAGSNPVSGRGQAHLDVLALLAVLLTLLVFLGWSALRGSVCSRVVVILQSVAGMLTVLMPLIEFARLRSHARNSVGASLMSIGTGWGFWGMLVSGGAMMALGLLSLLRTAEPDSSSGASLAQK